MTRYSIDIASTVTALGQTKLSAPGSGGPIAAPASSAIRFSNVARLGAGGMGVVESVWDGGSPVAEHAPAVKQLARFYVSRDRRLSQLRVMDIDMIAASGTALGITLGVLLAGRIGRWWWIALVMCVLAAIPPSLAWKRAMRTPPQNNHRG